MASDSIKIGKIWGININLHWTFVMLMLLVLLLSANLFIIFLLLFVCVLIHELAHAYTSIRNKVKVREIILTPIGGATIIDMVNIDPKVEFNTAIAGPITSLVLGGVFGILVTLTQPGTLTYLLQELFLLNMLLGAFNILPAFPLDGGRVFRSYLERKYDSFKATVLTVRLSKYMAALFVVVPAVYLLYITASPSYKLLEFTVSIIVALVLYGGAQAELQSAMLKRNTRGLTIEKATSREFMLVEPGCKLKTLYSMVEKNGISIVLTKIKNEFMLVDLFNRKNPNASRVSDLAISIPQLKPRSSVIDALQTLENSGRGIGVVVDRKKPIGVVTNQHLNALISLHMLGRNQPN